jgi:hypothetical protein
MHLWIEYNVPEPVLAPCSVAPHRNEYLLILLSIVIKLLVG